MSNLDLAKDQTSPQKILVKLAKDKDCWVRWAVAEHTKISKEIFEILASDENDAVLMAVIRNRKVPIEILIKLEKNEDYYIRKEARKALADRNILVIRNN